MRYLQIFLVFLFLFFFLMSQKSVDHIKLGDRYLKEGKVAFAREEYNRALKSGKVPEEIIVERLKKIDYMHREDEKHIIAAREFEKRGDYDQAIAEYRGALKINPENISAMHELLKGLFRAGRNDEGLDVINMLTQRGIQDENTNYYSALYDYRCQKFETARTKLKKCFAYARDYRPAKDLLEMINKKIAETRQKKSILAREHYMNGLRYLKNRDFKMAAVEFQDSLAAAPPEDAGAFPAGTLEKKLPYIEEYTKVGVYFNYSVASEYKGSFDDAISALEKINDIKPQFPAIYFKIAENHKKAERDQDAYRFYLKVAELDSSYSDIYPKLGYTAKKIGLYEEAVSHFRRACEYDPQNPINFYNLAIMQKKLEKYHEALEIFNRALALTSNDSNLKYLIMEQLELINRKLNTQTAFNKTGK